MAAQQPARTSPELRARLHSARANVGITPRPGALPSHIKNDARKQCKAFAAGFMKLWKPLYKISLDSFVYPRKTQ